MRKKWILFLSLAATAAGVTGAKSAWAQDVGSPDLGPPPRTEWKPEGCRAVPAQSPVLASRATWRNLHGDGVSSDEVSTALAPVFAADYVAEPNTFNPTGPVFDSAGNLYFSPFVPLEPVVLISLDPDDGSRRWAVPATTEAPVGAGAPMVLRDPDRRRQELVYVGLYDRAIAVRTDGELVWDVPTGLSGTQPVGVFGVQYVPSADAIMAIAADGLLYALDRRTGATLLDAPFELPGSPPPESSVPALPEPIAACVQEQFASLTQMTSLDPLLQALLGGGAEVANAFAVDPHSSRIWVTATAPDGADGLEDGVSELGALYGLNLVRQGAEYEMVQQCSRFFEGGSASTPALRQDGTRVYVADSAGTLIAVDRDCHELWTLDVGAQIVGSVAVSSDNDELYVSTSEDVFQVFDRDTEAVLGWQAQLEVFDVPPALPLVHRNLQIVGIGASGLGVQVGLAHVDYPRLTSRAAVVVLDRQTGEPRWAAEGLDESVAVMSSGPDGACYIGNSPVRRIISFCFAQLMPFLIPDTVAPPVGGITKYTPRRFDLLIRDAVCAAADRAHNAAAVSSTCPESVEADIVQIRELLTQARRSAPQALEEGELVWEDWSQAKRNLAFGRFWLRLWNRFHERSQVNFTLRWATRRLERACSQLDH